MPSPSPSRGTCLDFNNSYCNWQNCKYVHACSFCGLSNHGRKTCFKLNKGVETPSFRRGQDGEDFQPEEDPQDVAISSKQCFTAVETTIASRSSPVFSLAKTPINLNTSGKELKFYEPQKALTILNGFSFGFPLYYRGPRHPRDAHNLKSARDRPEVVGQKIMKEVEVGQVAGPFDTRPLPALQVSPLGLVPKKEPGEY